MKRVYFLLVVLSILSAYSAIANGEVVDKIVAVVNDEVITQSDVDESTLSFIADYRQRYGDEEAQKRIDEAKNDALNRLIEEKLILQEAKKRNVQIDEAEVEKRFQDAKKRFASEEEYNFRLHSLLVH